MLLCKREEGKKEGKEKGEKEGGKERGKERGRATTPMSFTEPSLFVHSNSWILNKYRINLASNHLKPSGNLYSIISIGKKKKNQKIISFLFTSFFPNTTGLIQEARRKRAITVPCTLTLVKAGMVMGILVPC